MNPRKRISLALAAFVALVLLGAGSAFAQTVSFNLGTAPTFVANTGRSEVIGQVTLTADATCGTAADALCTSTAGTLQILYIGTPIDNGAATGITVTDSTTAYVVGGSVTVSNGTAGGVVSFSVNGAVDFAAGDQVTIAGVRGQIDQSPGSVVGTALIGQLTASPSTIAAFSPTQETVARSADPLTMAFDPTTILQCQPGAAADATITVTEGFNTAFVDHGDADEVEYGASSAPSNPRPTHGGVNNSRINIVLTGLPSGVTITWPDQSDFDSGTGGVDSILDLVDQSTSGDRATYVYGTDDQSPSDTNTEVFVITLDTTPVTGNVELSGTTNDFGTATGQGQMHPPATPSSARPRYNHPLEPTPAAALLTVAPCTTNLLFPWVLNFGGYDTGMAIANTSADPYGTVPQSGTCTLNLFPTDTTTNNGVALAGPISVTTANVQAGSVWRATMSGTSSFAGKAGYIIAVCRFQYGHGFGFITDNFGLGAFNTSQGYLAPIIADPLVGNLRNATPGGVGGLPPTGEGLGQ
jgi:hypothetical protein